MLNLIAKCQVPFLKAFWTQNVRACNDQVKMIAPVSTTEMLSTYLVSQKKHFQNAAKARVHWFNHHSPAPLVSGDWFFGRFLLRLSRIKRPQVISMVKFSSIALNLGYDFVLLVHFLRHSVLDFYHTYWYNATMCVVLHCIFAIVNIKKRKVWTLQKESFCISCGILVSGIRARGVSSEHMENMEMFSCSPT